MSTKFKRDNYCETVVLCLSKKTASFAVTLWTVRPWRVRLAAGQWSPRFAGHYFVSWPALVCIIIIIINGIITSAIIIHTYAHSTLYVVHLCICCCANLVQLKRLALAYFHTALSAQHPSLFCSGSQTYFEYITFGPSVHHYRHWYAKLHYHHHHPTSTHILRSGQVFIIIIHHWYA